MKVQRYGNNAERKLLIAMIVSTPVLAKVAPRWDRNMFPSEWGNLVGKWCVRYYNKYGRAPGRNIEGLFETWAERSRSPENVELVEKLLGSLSGQYKKVRKGINPDWITDLAGDYFNRVALANLADGIQAELDAGNISKADSLRTNYNRIELGVGSYIDILRDPAAVEAAFLAKTEVIVKHKGALANFWQDALERDGFVAFMAPDKTGKSYHLLDLGWRAMLQKKRVAYFQAGDLSQNQIMRRFLCRAAKHPFTSPGNEWPCIVKRPIYITPVGGRRKNGSKLVSVDVEYKEHTFDSPLTIASGNRAFKEVAKSQKGCYLRLSVHPNYSINVEGIKSILEDWARNDWVADVVIIDYADVLAPPAGIPATDKREQIGMTWMQLRSLSQSQHCLLVTATQSDSAAYNTELLDRINFSEDKRKLSHVTGMVGINITKDEKKQGVARLNWLVLREGEFHTDRCVYVAGALAVANPSIVSTFVGE